MVAVVSVVEPVDDAVEPVLESGVVVVIVVTMVVLLVVTVVTIVVVACAPNGAAPAVIAAVTAPSASSVVKAAPQRAYLRFLLMAFPLPRRPRSYACQVVEGQTLLFNRFQVHPRPGDAVVLEAEDDHAAEL